MAFCDNNIEYEGRQNLLTSHAKLRAIWQNVILPLNQASISNIDLKFVVTFYKCQCYQLVRFNCLTLELSLVFHFSFFYKSKIFKVENTENCTNVLVLQTRFIFKKCYIGEWAFKKCVYHLAWSRHLAASLTDFLIFSRD